MVGKLAVDGGEPVHDGSPIPLTKVSYGWEEMREVMDVFQRGAFCALNPKATTIRDLEAAVAEVVGTKHVIAFSSGANAQHASLSALNLGPGDEVIVPALTFFSTAYTVLLQNAVPVFADVDPETITIDPSDVRRKVTEKTRAIVPVHWFGWPADMDGILAIAEEHRLAVIEDCAHALGMQYKGRRAGTMGHMGCFSMQETKQITSAGDGGFLTTDDDGHAERARMARDHGRIHVTVKPGSRAYTRYESIGNHYRLTEIQAAFALAQLRKLDRFEELRAQHTRYLDDHLHGIEGMRFQKREGDVKMAHTYYPVLFEKGRFSRDIDGISDALIAEGITVWPIAKDETCHTQPVLTEQGGRGRLNCPFGCPYYSKEVKYGFGTMPRAERIAEELLLLPLYPDMTPSELGDVVTAVQKVAEALLIDG